METITRILAQSKLLWAGGDALFLLLSIALGFMIRYPGGIPGVYGSSLMWVPPLMVGVMLVIYSAYGLYTDERRQWRDALSVQITALGVFFASVAAGFFMVRELSFPRPAFVYIVICTVLLHVSWRRVIWRSHLATHGRRRVLVIAGQNGNELREKAAKALGCYAESIAVLELGDLSGVALNGSPETGEAAVARVCQDEAVDMIVVDPTIPDTLRAAIACNCFVMKKELLMVPTFYEVLLADAKLRQLDDSPVFEVQLGSNLDRVAPIKRLMDVVFAVTGLVLFAPVMLVVAIFIKATSKGPVLFKQVRVGLGGREFHLYKFRTMVQDAEAKSGPVMSSKDDPRITRVGRILRATRLDELPQLVNVLRGDMSIVGPRPERPYFMNEFSKQIPLYPQRLRVPGGVTGLAQVLGRYSTSPYDKLVYDLIYAKTASPSRDLKIILRTLHAMLSRDKAA